MECAQNHFDDSLWDPRIAEKHNVGSMRENLHTQPCLSFKKRIALLLVLMPALGLRAAQGEVADSPIALYTSFQHPMPAAAVQHMREELNWITDPVGLRFSWRTYADAQRYPAVARLAVVHFRGRCDTGDLTQFHSYPWKLGWTHTVDGQVIPYVDVFCDAIRAYIAPLLQSTGAQEREAAFGRAVGRVVAHELYHVFAETKKHGSSGLAKANCTPQELLAEDYRLGENELRRLRAVLAQTMLLGTTRGTVGEGEKSFAANGCVGCHGLRGDGTIKAPAITTARLPKDVGDLRSRLINSNSEMSRRARDLDLSWSKIGAGDLTTMLKFLKEAKAMVSLEAATSK